MSWHSCPEQLWLPLDPWNVQGQAGHWGWGQWEGCLPIQGGSGWDFSPFEPKLVLAEALLAPEASPEGIPPPSWERFNGQS